MRTHTPARVIAAVLLLACGTGAHASQHRNDGVYQAAAADRAAALELLKEIVNIDTLRRL